MKKALFVGVCLFAIGSVLAFGTPVQACITPWQGDEKVSKKPSPLHTAIENGDLLQVKKALKKGADVNQKQHSVCYGYITNHGSTALARAISFGRRDIASYLIEQGADVINISDYHIGYEPVAFVNDTSSVEKETQTEKLEFPEGLDQGASTLFSYANTPEMVHFVANVFKEKGILTQMVNHENREENNVLFPNIYECKEELIKALLSHGIKFSQNSGALEKAVLEGRLYKEKGGKLTGVISESCPSSFIDLLMEQGLELKDSKNVKEVFFKALYEYPNLAKKMIETVLYKLDLNGQYGYHNLTPLEIVLQSKNKDLATFLIQKGADVNYKDAQGNTLFQKTLSSQNPNIKLMETLLDIGVDANEQDEMGETPLHKALAIKYPNEIVSLLIKHGADVNIKDKEGRLPIHKVLSSQKPDIGLLILLLENGADANAKDKNGETPLQKALKLPHSFRFSQVLLKHGADVNIKDKEGCLPIHKVLSSQKPDIRLLTLLLENGADANAKDKNGETPLSPMMLESRDTSYIAMLLEKGLDVNSKDNQGNTLLHKAIFYQNKNLLDLLIQKGADVNVKDNKGEMPLIWAIKYHRLDIVRLLIEKGADMNVKDNKGETPLIWAIRFHRLDIVRLLIEKGADVNVKDGEGFSFLYHLILLNKLDLIELALQKGADVNIKSRNGETPLISAIKYRRLEVIKLLLEKGSDRSVKDESGKTALDYCMAWNKCAEIEALIVSKNN